jgi:hypothetical protein
MAGAPGASWGPVGVPRLPRLCELEIERQSERWPPSPAHQQGPWLGAASVWYVVPLGLR